MFLNRNNTIYNKYLIESCETLHFIILIIVDYKNVKNSKHAINV